MPDQREPSPESSAPTTPSSAVDATVGYGVESGVGNGSEPKPSGTFRTLGLDHGSIMPVTWTADDLELVDHSLAGAEARAVFVALAIHDPELTDRTLDAARWAIELLVSARASVFALMTMAEPKQTFPYQLEVRQWNHAVAMVEELRRRSERRGLAFDCFERLDGDPVDVVLPATALPTVGLDPCGYQTDGWKPARLVSPNLS